jgi:hypothetical protein
LNTESWHRIRWMLWRFGGETTLKVALGVAFTKPLLK